MIASDCVEQTVERGARGDDLAHKVFGKFDRGRRLHSFGVLLEDADPRRETVKALLGSESLDEALTDEVPDEELEVNDVVHLARHAREAATGTAGAGAKGRLYLLEPKWVRTIEAAAWEAGRCENVPFLAHLFKALLEI